MDKQQHADVSNYKMLKAYIELLEQSSAFRWAVKWLGVPSPPTQEWYSKPNDFISVSMSGFIPEYEEKCQCNG